MANLNQLIQSNASNSIVANMVKPSALKENKASTGPSFQDNMVQALKSNEAAPDPYNNRVSTPITAPANQASAPSMVDTNAQSADKNKKFGALMSGAKVKPNTTPPSSPMTPDAMSTGSQADVDKSSALLDLSTEDLMGKSSSLSTLGFDALGNEKANTTDPNANETETKNANDPSMVNTGLISPEAMLAQLNALNAKNSADSTQTVTEKVSEASTPMLPSSARLESQLQNNQALLDKPSTNTEDRSISLTSNSPANRASNDTFSDTLAQAGLANNATEQAEPMTTTLTARERALLQDQLKEGNPSISSVATPTQVALQQAPITAMVAKDSIAPRFGSDGWNTAVQQKVVWMVGQEQQSASLTLNPPDLGPLQIVINVSNDQANASFFSDNQDVRQALQDGMDNLRQSMKEAGIQLGQTNVGEQQQQNMAQHQAGLKPSTNAHNSVSQHAAIEAPAKGLTRVSQGLLDTFA